MFSKLMTWLLELTCKKVIIMDREEKEPYLVRYILLKTKGPCIYFHRFMQSDESVPHDHPFNFFTFVFTKGYQELKYEHDPEDGSLKVNKIIRKPLSLAFRRCHDIHVVEVDKKRNLTEINEAPLTACLIWRARPTWGFIVPKNGRHEWIDWRKFLGIDKNDPRYYGSE